MACSAYREDNPIQWLMDDLFEDQQYDPTIIPKEGKGAIDLGLGMSVINMDMDEAGFLSANVWMKYQWTDYRLTWDPEQYRGVKMIRVPASFLWRPDIITYNQKNTMLRLICKQARPTSTMLSSTPTDKCYGFRQSIWKWTVLEKRKY
eukprot:UN13686